MTAPQPPLYERTFKEQVRAQLELLVVKRRGLDEAVAEFSTRSPEAEYESAANTLTKFGKRALTPLIKALNDPDAAIRLEAVLALGRLGLPEALDALLPCLHDANADVQLAAVQTLAALGDARAGDALAGVLPDSAGPLRDAIAAALLSLCPPRGIALFTIPEPALGLQAHTRLVAAITIAGGAEAAARLERLPGDPASPQGLCTLKALAAVAPERAFPRLWPLLGYDYPVFREAFEILRDAHAPGLEAAIVQALHHPDFRVRRYAVEFLGRHGDDDAIAPVAHLLFNDPEYWARVVAPYALASLAQRTGVDVRPYLAKAQNDPHPSVQRSARHALEQLDQNRPISTDAA